MSSMPLHMLGTLKPTVDNNTNATTESNITDANTTTNTTTTNGGSLQAVAASLRLRRKRPTVSDPTLVTDASVSEMSSRRRAWKHLTNPFSPPTRRRLTKGSEADDSESDAPTKSPSLRPALLRAVSALGPNTPPQLYLPTPTRPTPTLPPNPTTTRPLAPHISTPEVSTPLDVLSLESPPHVAVRYGDTIRLFARSKYADGDSGGYVGTFEAGRRFLSTKTNSKKQGQLACVAPVASSVYRASSFTILSTNGRDVGAPVSYGDVVVLVDDRGCVWNNKIGAGPTARNGYFGPRDPNLPGEMYLSFYQLDDAESGSSSDSDSDDDESFLSLSALARSTKNMADATFGKPTQIELDVAAAALRTVGRVVYYGDRNVIIDVADSNRLRSKFNRVVTHFRKSDEPIVHGGYLRCDGKGKPITFELHGPPLATVQTIDVTNEAIEEEGDEDSHTNAPSLRIASSGGSIAVGRPLEIRDVHPTSVVSLLFSDGGLLKIPCSRFVDAHEKPFFRVVLGGARALRIQLHAVRSVRSKGKVSIRKTLLETYRDLAKLYGGVVIVSSVVAFVLSKLLRLTISLPAMYLGGVTVLGVFVLELFYPGRVLKSNEARHAPLSTADEDATGEYLGDWKLSIVSIEASATERVECVSPACELSRKQSSRALKIPKAFIAAENGNMTKAAERYEATLAWRREAKADTILTMPQIHYYTIRQHYHQYLHKTDKLGHPVCYQKTGINMKELQRLGISQEDLFNHYLFAMEFTLKYAANKICPCDACAGSETHKLFLVVDARGMGMKDLSGEGAEFIRKCTGIMQRHYPQRSYKIFFVNVPSWFGIAWKGIKPLLNETTRAKTNILNENDTPAGLLEHIDAENLPVEYGGTCACVGGCEDNSAYQQLQKKLVESIATCQPFVPEDFGDRRISDGMDSDAELARLRDSASSTGASELYSTTDSAFLADNATNLPPGLFRDDVVHSGYLLKRPMKHNNFTPIWNRRFFILHPDSLRFGKVPRSEIYQIVQLTAATTVRKMPKGNNTLELVTPLMAKNGHSLVLYAPTATALNKWVESLHQVIDKLAGKPPLASSAAATPVLSPAGSDVEGNGHAASETKQIE